MSKYYEEHKEELQAKQREYYHSKQKDDPDYKAKKLIYVRDWKRRQRAQKKLEATK